jgi:2-polyprenyl-3-methyl-5-hydroxy-6-metoxy-1,4-benzoquinol methylase
MTPELTLCPACGSSGWEPAGRARSLVALFDRRPLGRCPACGLVFVTEPPDADELAELNAQYWSVAQAPSRYSALVHEAQMQSRAVYLERHLGVFEGKRVLDIGAGTGLLGRVVRDRGWRIEYHAVESDPWCEAALRGNGAAFVWQDLAGCIRSDFDLVVLSHVLEHVTRPRELLATVRARLATGGYVFIEVPNQDHLHKHDFGTHLLSFAQPVLATLVAAVPGLAVTDIQSAGRPLSALVSASQASPQGQGFLWRTARRVAPESLWRLASQLADRSRAASVTIGSLEAELQPSTYGPERQWIRCLARGIEPR